MDINIFIFQKYRIILSLIVIINVLSLYSAEVNPEKISSSILNPEISAQTEAEKYGQNLKVVFNFQHKIINEKGSTRYYNLKYDNEKKLFNCSMSIRSGSSDYSWKIKRNINESGDYTVNGRHKGLIYFNSESKPLKIEYDADYTNEIIEEIFIDQGKFYIPDKILKPGDEWEYSFIDTSDFSGQEYEYPKYYKIEVKAVFKLAGYKDYENRRAAVITSQICINKVFVLLYKESMLNVKGGTLIYDIVSVNQLLIDYNTGCPLYCTMGITKKVKGTLHDCWGNTPEEAEKIVIDDYKGYVNTNLTDYTVYYVKYFNMANKNIKSYDE
ncbi:MAG: hypothetical protein JXB50_03015 [Spirochaetes bacterium]|nr:hypothetical protein [Spirochaetota bacterium]